MLGGCWTQPAPARRPSSKQGVDYTISTDRNSGGFCTDAGDCLNVMLIFCAAPNASRPTVNTMNSSSMKRTFCAAAADDRVFFECGRAWAVHAALCAARDAGAAIVVMPYIGGGLYAGPHGM